MRWIIIVMMGLLFGAPATAQELSWGRGSSTPTPNDFIPHLKSGEAYSERYTFNIPLDGGGEIYMDFTVSNLGWGDNKGATTARVTIPGQKTYHYRKELDGDEWSFDRKAFRIHMGKSSIETDGKGYRLRHEGSTRIDLKMASVVPAWRPGKGKIELEGQTFELALMAPKAHVSGRVGMNNTWIPVSSQIGMGDWTMSTIAPYDLAQRFSRFKAYEDDYMVTWREIKTTKDLGNKSIVWVLVMKGDDVVFESASATLTASAEYTDKKSDYRVPRVFRIDASKGGKKISLTVRGSRPTVRDLLADHGSVARAIAGTMTKPFEFNSDATFTLKLPTGDTISGRGPLGVDILNQ